MVHEIKIINYTTLCYNFPQWPRIHDIRIACHRMETQRATYDVTQQDRPPMAACDKAIGDLPIFTP